MLLSPENLLVLLDSMSRTVAMATKVERDKERNKKVVILCLHTILYCENKYK
jgi:hypothetical protein